MDLKFHIDTSKCVRCGACIRDCAPAILEFGSDGFPRVIDGGAEHCTHCQHCLAVCPAAAVEIFGRNPADSVPSGRGPAPEALLNLIANRRSFRSYRRENLDASVMEKLREMLRFVPTGVNDHSLFFAFVDQLDVMDEIRGHINGKLNWMLRNEPDSPLLARLSRYRKQLEAGRDVIFRGAPHMVIVAARENSPCPTYDPIIALSYFELYAQSLGIGTVWCGLAAGALAFFPEIVERLQLPEGYHVGYVMLFGPSNLKYPRAVQPDPVGMVSVK